jgi:hypothetical protein
MVGTLINDDWQGMGWLISDDLQGMGWLINDDLQGMVWLINDDSQGMGWLINDDLQGMWWLINDDWEGMTNKWWLAGDGGCGRKFSFSKITYCLDICLKGMMNTIGNPIRTVDVAAEDLIWYTPEYRWMIYCLSHVAQWHGRCVWHMRSWLFSQ